MLQFEEMEKRKMDIAKVVKLSSDELQKEIEVRKKKIKSLKNEIALLERLAQSADQTSHVGVADGTQKQEEPASAGSRFFTE